MNISRERRAILSLTLTSIVWGFAMASQRVADRYLSPFQFNFFKYFLAALCLMPFAALKKRRDGVKVSGGDLLRGFTVGAALFLAALGQQSGVGEAGAGKAGFITSLYVVLVPLAGLMLGQRMKPIQWFAIIPAVAGSWLLCASDDLSFSLSRAELWLLLGSIFWTVHIQCTDHFVRKTDPTVLCFIQFSSAALLNLVCMLFTGLPSGIAMKSTLFPMLYCGILSTGFGFLMQAKGQKDAPPAIASLVMSLEAVFSLLSGVLLLGETFTLRALTGCLLMFSGVILSQLGENQALTE